MGADIRVDGRVAVVRGRGGLHGASVRSTDLRGGAALVIAALGARGTSQDPRPAAYPPGIRGIGAGPVRPGGGHPAGAVKAAGQ